MGGNDAGHYKKNELGVKALYQIFFLMFQC